MGHMTKLSSYPGSLLRLKNHSSEDKEHVHIAVVNIY
jgi:hypothetical protein